ncbi:MAG: D-2-hydroxyacid dehydrogenase [Sedimentisphaerales bacterium]|nr:D-2-hydroxyacid dehydrogenase [Sedimentisphaerales bacterium]
MKIAVLDGYTLNPGDLSWDSLEALGECIIHDRSAPEQVVPRANGAEIVLTNKTVLSAESIARLTKLKFISVLATGYNIVDVEAARRRGVPVSNVPTYGTESVVQMVFAHLLNLTLHVGHHARTVREGRWMNSVDFCYWDTPLVELQGLTMGIVGFGRIGRSTARVARAFGMNVVVYDITPHSEMPDGYRRVELNDVFRESDVVSLHCPLTSQTENLVNAEQLTLMKPTAYLINTSRGPLIDEQALADALNNDEIAGAGVDVLSTEPAAKDNPLLTAKNCHITPHIAWATRAARERLLKVTVDNVAAFIAGKPQNVVNNVKS